MAREGRNNLNKEKSPYLKQHASNPVWWHPWSEEAFRLAAAEQKLIFLSIGYSTCHWCHVMEKESFENESIAKILNDNFISIKVDREERPDVDAMYMRAVQVMTGQGGWPMSVFLTPNKEPIFGGTYYPASTFGELLRRLTEAWSGDRARIEDFGKEMIRVLGTEEKQSHLKAATLNKDIPSYLIEDAKKSFDPEWGGFGEAPKFPTPAYLRTLLKASAVTKNDAGLKMVTTTLEKMSLGGIYDHLGGGFARYSTDEQWCIPHFEKMLYDNAALVTVYLEAFKATENLNFKTVAVHTLNYLLRDMQSNAGGFYTAEDADSDGKEGTFYAWKETDFKKILNSSEYLKLCSLYQISPRGNFEDSQIILNAKSNEIWKLRGELALSELETKLLTERKNRNRPLRDDKILTESNGLMIEALAIAYEVTEDPNYLNAAIKTAEFIKQKLWNGTNLLRRYCEGESKFDAVLDDYAFLVAGLLVLSQVLREDRWVQFAMEIQAAQDTLLWDERGGGYYYSTDPEIIARKEYHDGAMANGNGVSALNLLKFSELEAQSEYYERAKSILLAIQSEAIRMPRAFGSIILAQIAAGSRLS